MCARRVIRLLNETDDKLARYAELRGISVEAVITVDDYLRHSADLQLRLADARRALLDACPLPIPD